MLEVKRDIDIMPFEITKADNGDAWVNVKGDKLSTSTNLCRSIEKNEENCRRFLG